MEIINIAICEDLEKERNYLAEILDNCQYPNSVDIFKNAEEFLKHFKPYKYDLILMDIYMSGITGIEAITQIRILDKDVSVAFVTSSNEFTLESYRLDALKYIEKPASKKDIEKVLKLVHSKKLEVDSLIIRNGNVASSYQLKRIIFLEQSGRNTIIHLTGGESVSVPKKLTQLEDQLEDKNFLRCHKSYIANLEFIQSVDKELMIFKMSEGENVHISRKLFWTLKKDFEKFIFEQTRGIDDE